MIRNILVKIKDLAFKLANKSSKLSSFYYALLSGEFNNEHYSVISGINKNKQERKNIGNFRRSIHRIEKGLITYPAKPVFAQDYILNTVEIFKEIHYLDIDQKTIKWAHGVLKEYFSSAPDTAINIEAKQIYKNIIIDINKDLPKTYYARQRIKSNITYADFLTLNKQRRSIRYFLDKQVPRTLIEKAIEVAAESPSACNRQPFVFRVIDDPELLKEAVLLPNGAQTFSESIKVMIFLIGDHSNYFSERDKHLIYIDASLAAMSFILALETLDISSCIVNWADIESNNLRLKNFLQLEYWEQCIMSIAIGYASPDCRVASSVKKEIKTLVKYN